MRDAEQYRQALFPEMPSGQGAARYRQVIVVLSCLVLLAGCSTRFLYDQLDRLVVWKVNSYVSLSGEQKDGLSERVSDYLNLVRQNDLPQLAAILESTATDVQGNQVTVESLNLGYIDMIALTDRLLAGVVPISAWLLSDLSDEQIAELFENFEELNQDMYEEYSGRSEEERRKNRNRSSIKMTQRFTGRLSREQKDLITGSLAEMEDASEEWIGYQRLWQQRFRDLIEAQPPLQEFEDELEQLFVYPRNMHTAEYRARVDRNRQRFNAMLEELIDGLTDRQRARTVDKLHGYEKMLLKLADDS